MDGGVARHFRYSIYASNPQDPLEHLAEIYEWFVVDSYTILSCVKEVSQSRPGPPLTTMEDAKNTFRQFFEENTPYIRYVADSTTLPAAEAMFSRYSFLGMTPDGPIWRLAKPVEDSERNAVYAYTAKDGVEYQLVRKPRANIFHNCSLTFPSTQSTALRSQDTGSANQPFTYRSEVVEIPDGFQLTSTSIGDPDGPNRSIVYTTEKIYDFEIGRNEPIRMTLLPSDGEEIHSLQTPQIKFEWRDGKIVKRINPFVTSGNADEVKFQRSQSVPWLLILNAGIVTGILIWLLWKWRNGRAILLLLSVFSGLCSTVAADNVYCGIHAVCAAAQSLGVDARLETLVDPQFVSSQRGSTTEDLVRAAQSVGLEAIPLAGLGVASLRAAKDPLILHVAPPGTKGVYQHWILFLGTDEHGKARVLDGGGGVVHCTFADVLARWNGIAIAVHLKDSNGTQFLAHEFSSFLSLLTLGLSFCLLVRFGLPGVLAPVYRWRFPMLGHVLSIALVSMAAAIASDGSEYRDAAASIDMAFGLKKLPSVSYEQIEVAAKAGAAIIDCRYVADYKHNHIAGALNVPVNIGLGDFYRRTSSIVRTEPVYVYCQSPQCSFSKYTAVMLISAGFCDVRVFEGGFDLWFQHQHQATNEH